VKGGGGCNVSVPLESMLNLWSPIDNPLPPSIQITQNQQLSATLTDAGASKGQSLRLAAAQGVGGTDGRTHVAIDATFPLTAAPRGGGGGSGGGGSGGGGGTTPQGALALGISHRLETGGLVKAKAQQDGVVTLLYESRVQVRR